MFGFLCYCANFYSQSLISNSLIRVLVTELLKKIECLTNEDKNVLKCRRFFTTHVVKICRLSIMGESQLNYFVLLKHSSSWPHFFILLLIKVVQGKEKSNSLPLSPPRPPPSLLGENFEHGGGGLVSKRKHRWQILVANLTANGFIIGHLVF